MLGLIPSFLGLEIETLRPPGRRFLRGMIVQLGKGGMDPSGGLPPPRTPPLAKDVFDFWLKRIRCLGPILANKKNFLAGQGLSTFS